MCSEKVPHPPDEVCWAFITNENCEREAKGQCPYVHDWVMLYRYLGQEEKAVLCEKFAADGALKTSASAVESKTYSAVVESKTSASALTSSISAPAITINIPTSTIALKASAPVPYKSSTPDIASKASSVSSSTPAAAQKFIRPPSHDALFAAMTNSISRNHPQNESTVAPQLSSQPFATAYANPSEIIRPAGIHFRQLAPSPAEVTDIVAKIQEVFVNVDDSIVPSSSTSQSPSSSPEVEIIEDNSTAPSSPTSHSSRDTTEMAASSSSEVSVVVYKATAPPSPASQKSTAIIQTNASSSALSLCLPTPRKHWDNNSYWRQWALENFCSATSLKLLAPYLNSLDNGAAPRKIFHVRRTDQVIPGAANTFHYFQNLPYELREMIWKMGLAVETRNCRIKYEYELDTLNRHVEKRFKPLLSAPPLLQVNRESRELVLRSQQYEKAFGTGDFMYRIGFCWFNFDTDRLFLHTKDEFQYRALIFALRRKDKSRVKRLAIPFKDLIKGDLKEIGGLIACGFPNLEQLDAIAGDGLQDAQWTQPQPKAEREVAGWFRSNWLKFYPKATTTPIVKLELIPQHIAHMYEITGFVW